MHAKTRIRLSVFLCVLCVFVVSLAGCKEKRKALVSAHTVVGELLVSTKDQARMLRATNVINEKTYNAIRINWLRAQASYIKASDILEAIIDNDESDIAAYTELLTQVNTILSDIAMWLSEPQQAQTPAPTPTKGVKNESGGNSGINIAAPANDRKSGIRAVAPSGTQRGGQGGAEKVGQGNEGQGKVADVGILALVSVCDAVISPNDLTRIHGITGDTRDVRVWLSGGEMAYTLDGSEPVETHGRASVLLHGQCLEMRRSAARKFRARAGVQGARMHVMIVETHGRASVQ
ncbi:MAG: hypothetical protein NG747_13245 [Candidatus Brocadia sp.]|nr:hypothetical protein [Candidatus Brocadia sp.]